MKIGLALSGGGARGFAHIKILEAFDELGIKPTIISGTSIGALIGSLYASGMEAKEIKDYFKKLNFTKYAQMFDISFSNKGLVKGNKVQKIFNKLIQEKQFKDLKIPLKIVATNFYTRKQKIFEKGNVSKAVRASISIPGVFEPVIIGKSYYVDGGLTNLIPFDILKDSCDYVIAIDVADEFVDKTKDLTLFECIASSFSMVQTMYAYNNMKNNSPDYYLKINLKNYFILDFNKFEEIYNKTNKYKLIMKKHLKELLKI